MLLLLYLVVKAQQYFVTSSCMFLDEKIVLEIWLNPGVKLNHLSRNRALRVNKVIIVKSSSYVSLIVCLLLFEKHLVPKTF